MHNYAFEFSPFYFFGLNWVGCLFHCNTGPLESIASSNLMFRNAISLKPVVGTYIDGITPVYNGKSIRGVPSDFPFVEYLEYLLDSVSEKSKICNLVSDGKNFFPLSRNTDHLLQIDVNAFLIVVLFL